MLEFFFATGHYSAPSMGQAGKTVRRISPEPGSGGCALDGYDGPAPMGAASSLYVHIPFCRSKCAYCDFFSLSGFSEEAMEAYAQSLILELEAYTPIYPDLLPREGLRSIYIGGGTPSILPVPALRFLLKALFPYLKKGGEWSIECNPESLNEEKLKIFEDGGITRISLGLQSLEDQALQIAGRPGRVDEGLRALSLLGRLWKGSWSADLIAGLPGQSLDGLVSDIKRACDAGASHISLYSLSIEEGSGFHRRLLSQGPAFLPPAELADDMFFAAKEELGRNGLRRYEVSNWALAGRECRHNLGYWQVEPYLGIGPGAVSTLRLPGSETLRINRAQDLSSYLDGSQADCGASSYERISAQESLRDYLLMSLRTTGAADCGYPAGAQASVLSSRFALDGKSLLSRLGSALKASGFSLLGGLGGVAEALMLDDTGLDRLNPALLEVFRCLDAL